MRHQLYTALQFLNYFENIKLLTTTKGLDNIETKIKTETTFTVKELSDKDWIQLKGIEITNLITDTDKNGKTQFVAIVTRGKKKLLDLSKRA